MSHRSAGGNLPIYVLVCTVYDTRGNTQINQDLPAPARQRLNELIEKRQASRISPAELEELIQLTDQAEEFGVER